MYSYTVFGGQLVSELAFPELQPSENKDANWTLRVSESRAQRGGTQLLGSGLEPHCLIELYRETDSLRLFHSCTGSFQIRRRGREIIWSPAPDVRVDAARADILGRVLAIAMHVQGVLTLHASAVAFESGAIAFIAPKRYGKSTLAMALAGGGARVVTDDMLPIRLDSSPMVVPGVQSVRLHEDSASSLYCREMATRIGVDGKCVIDQLERENILTGEAPLRAIYVLSPVNKLSDGAPVKRTRLSAVSATMSLVTHMKVGALLGALEASAVLDRAALLARAVPVYQLALVRDLQQISDVVDCIYGWHETSATVEV